MNHFAIYHLAAAAAVKSLQSCPMIQDAWGWCTGMTQRHGTGREEGGGFRMGNTCIPWRIHVDVWQNQYNTVK